MKKFAILFKIAQFLLVSGAKGAEGSQPSEYELFCKQAKGPDIKMRLKTQEGQIRNLNARTPNSDIKVTVTSASSGNLLPVNVSFARSKGTQRNVNFDKLSEEIQNSKNFFGITSCIVNDTISEPEKVRRAAPPDPNLFHE